MVGGLLLAPLLALGCGEDLPECDPEAARQVYFRADGRPSYAGQAMMEVSCSGGGSFCHAPGSRGSDRKGVPAGLDFHVAPACSASGECEPDERERLSEDHRRVVARRHGIASEVRAGRMPPGSEGRGVEEATADAHRYNSVFDSDDEATALPSVRTSEGRAILLQWLACDAPVVESTEPASGGALPGDPCGEADEDPESIGDCRVAAGQLEPTWDSIYANVIAVTCAQCHGPGDLDIREDSMLDLSDQDTAYEALLGGEGEGAPAAGLECAGMGTLVVPGDPDGSLLVEKLEAARDGSADVCGDPMPGLGEALPEGRIDAIRDWIAAGADR